MYHGKDVKVVKENNAIHCKGTFPDTQTADSALICLVNFGKTHGLGEPVKKIQGLSVHLELSL